MKKPFTLLAAGCLILGLNYQAITSSFQPPAAHTGAPGENTCATSGCHSGNLNTGSGSIALQNLPTAYVPGTTYTLQVVVNTAGQPKAGFELVALNSQNQQAGTFAVVNATTTILQSLNGKQYISHRSASATSSWTVNWTAPATNVGVVSFYMAGNAANNNFNTTGDFIYTSSATLNPGTGTGIAEENAVKMEVYPNPASEKLNLEFAGKATNLKIFDFTGREMHAQKKAESKTQLDLSKYPSGTYFLQVEQNKTLQLKRFVVQH